MKKIRRRRIFAFLMSAVMAVTVLVATPAQIDANPVAPPPVLTQINDSSLTWTISGVPSGFVVDSISFESLEGGWHTVWDPPNTGTFSLSTSGFNAGTHRVRARIVILSDDSLVNVTSGWSSTITLHGGLPQLATPTGLQMGSDGILRWSSVHSMATYFLWVDFTNHAGSLQSIPFETSGTSWNLNPHLHLFRPGQTVSFDISASAPGFNHSSTAHETWWFPGTTQQLSAPTNLSISDTILSWSPVTNAGSYRVYVNGTARGSTTTATSFDLRSISLSSGSHSVQVRALAGSGTSFTNSGLSSSVTFNTWGTGGMLSAPTNLWISGSMLHWNSVSGAVGYRIYVGGVGQTETTSATSFDLSRLNIGSGNRSIQVRALGNHVTTQNSSLSSSVNFNASGTATATPTPRPAATPTPTPVPALAPAQPPSNLRVVGNVLHWDGVPNVAGYNIYVGGVARTLAPTVATHFSLNALGLPAGYYTVQVRAIGNEISTLNSGLSTGVNFTSTGQRATQPQATPAPTPVATPAPTPTQPADPPSAWASNSVNIAISHGLVPQNLRSQYTQATTRAEFAALAVALYETATGLHIPYGLPFHDTDDVNVQKMGWLGVVEGTGDGYFRPNETLTREQAAVMLARLADVIGQPLPQASADFADNAAISPWARSAVGRVQAAGIMNGAANAFSPQGPYTREQSIVTMLRLFDIVR